MPSMTASDRKDGRRACAVLALVSALLVLAWSAGRIHYEFGGNWTAAFFTGSRFVVPPDLREGTYCVEGTGYDGQFYRYLAHDPFLRKGYSRYVDSPQLRFRRILVPFAAWLLALGQQGRIDGAYIAVEMIFVALGVYWCARLMVRRRRSFLWGSLFLILPATLTSFDRMLVDGPLAAWFAGFLLYVEERRWARVWLVAAAAALTRDTGLLLIAALVIDRVLQSDWRRAMLDASSAVPAAAWYAYLAAVLPRDAPVSIFSPPILGWVGRLLWLRPYPDPRVQLLLRVTDVLAVLGLGASIFIAAWWIRKGRPDPGSLAVGLFALLGLVLGAPAHMIDSFGFARPVSPLLLWVMLEAVSRKVWGALAPPLLVSVSVGLIVVKPIASIASGVLGR
jgi:hypothetical protein